MEIEVRPADDYDAAGMLVLLEQLMQESTTFTLEQDVTKLTPQQEAQNITNLQTTTNNIILLAVGDEKELLGILSVAALPNTPREAELGMAVLAAYQGYGLGQLLLAAMFDWFDDYSTLETIRLTVQSGNAPAIHIYEKVGFERVAGSETQVVNSEGTTVPAFEMVYRQEGNPA